MCIFNPAHYDLLADAEFLAANSALSGIFCIPLRSLTGEVDVDGGDVVTPDGSGSDGAAMAGG